MISQALTLTISGWLGLIAVIMFASISPEMKSRPPLIFKYPTRERNAALITAGVFMLLSILLAAFTPDWILTLPARFNNLEWSIGILGFVCIIIAFLVLRYRKQPWLSFGWHRKLWRLGSRIGLALFFVSFFLGGSLSRVAEIFSADSLNTFFILLGFNLAWETALRGFIQPRLSAWLGSTWGWLATSFFGILLLLPLAFSFGASPDFIIRYAGNQILLGWVMKRSGHVFPGAIWAASFAWFMNI